MSIQEIDEFVQGELSYLNLTTKQKEKYITFINKLDNYISKSNMTIDATNLFYNKLEECLDFFKLQGFDDERSLELAKSMVLESDRRDWKEKLCFLRLLGWEETTVCSNSLTLRFNLSQSHAKKMFLLNKGLVKEQSRNCIIHDSIDTFEKRFNVKMDDLLMKYPITKELINVWLFIGLMNGNDFNSYFGITRKQLSFIYPTTKEEVAIIHKISTMSDEEIIEKYGITKDELLSKYPLNNDTLRALSSIRQTNEITVKKLFGKSKDEILKLRTISTEMILEANKKYKFQKRTYSKEELRQQFKIMKKGTIIR